MINGIFDIHHSFAAAISYEVPSPKGDVMGRALLRGWALYGLLHINSAAPFNLYAFPQSPIFGSYETLPDVVPGVPFYLPSSNREGDD